MTSQNGERGSPQGRVRVGHLSIGSPILTSPARLARTFHENFSAQIGLI
jgi:hypothetical protein